MTAPTSTTTGSPTRSRSTTRGRRGPRHGRRDPQERQVRQRRLRRRKSSLHHVPGRRHADPGRQCALHRQASFYAATSPTRATTRRGGRRLRVLPAAVDATRSRCSVAASSWRRSPTAPRSQAFQDLPRRPSGRTSRPRHSRGIGQREQGRRPEAVHGIDSSPSRSSRTRDGLPLRRLRPDAGRGGLGHFWKGMTDWINGQATRGDPGHHRGLLAETAAEQTARW